MDRKIATERSSVVMTTWYYLIGPEGAVQFMLMTSNVPTLDMTYPVDLGIHSRKPSLGTPMNNCEVLGGPCHYSGSSNLAMDLYNRFKRKQDPEFLWQELESHYERAFRSI